MSFCLCHIGWKQTKGLEENVFFTQTTQNDLFLQENKHTNITFIMVMNNVKKTNKQLTLFVEKMALKWRLGNGA